MIYKFDGMTPEIDSTCYISESATIIGNVKIGPYCYIGPGAIIRADSKGKPIEIGYGSAIEEGVIIHVGGPRTNGCYIGERVTIGHGAIVHCNKLGLYSEMGEYAVIAEGAVVKQGQIIEPKVVVGGAPAKVLRQLLDRDLETWDKTKDWYIGLTKLYTTPGVLERID